MNSYSIADVLERDFKIRSTNRCSVKRSKVDNIILIKESFYSHSYLHYAALVNINKLNKIFP